MQFDTDHADGALAIDLADPVRGRIGGHPAPDDEVCVVWHRPSLLNCFGEVSLDHRCNECQEVMLPCDMTPARAFAAAQTIPLRGDVDANLEQHARLAQVAADEQARVLVFPELSLTGYE